MKNMFNFDKNAILLKKNIWKKVEKLKCLFDEIKILLLIVIVLALFRTIVQQTISTLLVIPILSKIQVDYLIEIGFLGCISYIGFKTYFRHKRTFFVSNKFIFVIILILPIYFYYRIDQEIWIFLGLKTFPFIKLLDIIPFYLFCLLLLRVTQKKKKKLELSKGFYLDAPLGQNGIDGLNRECVAENLAIEILDTSSEEFAFAIGISSEWGSGKTSFMDLLQRNLNKVDDENIIINFNPWINLDSKNIIKDFFNNLNQKLSQHYPEISPIIQRYIEALIGVNETNLNRLLNPLLSHYKYKTTIQAEFKAINSIVKSINKKIIIFIDDLDRLYKEEIVEVIKLIRNSANFGNTFFIVAYDRSYIVNAIKEVSNTNPELYLEKIFQLEIQLPNFENQKIQQRIFELINPRILDKDKEELMKILLKKKNFLNMNIFSSGHLTTLRDATRFANSFLMAYNHLKGEISLYDLLQLEILRLKYPGLYKLIFFNSETYLEPITNNDSDKTVYSLRKEKKQIKGKEVKVPIIKSYLDLYSDKIGVPKENIDKSINLLYSLFANSEYLHFIKDVELLSVSIPSCFERYSHYRLMDSNISELEFSQYREKSLDEFCTKIDEWVAKGLRWELKRRFEEIKVFSNATDCRNIITAIFYFARIKKNKSIENDFSGFDFDNLYKKLSNIETYLSLNYFKTNDEYREFVTNIFETAPTTYDFEIEFIYTIMDKYATSDNFIITKEKLNQIRLNYFKNHLAKSSSIDATIWNLYYYNDLVIAKENGEGSKSYQIFKTKNPEATALLINFIETIALDDFLHQIRSYEPFDKKLVTISEIVLKIFESYSKFGLFLQQFDETKYKNLKEFNLFFKELERVDFKKYIEFEFSAIPALAN